MSLGTVLRHTRVSPSVPGAHRLPLAALLLATLGPAATARAGAQAEPAAPADTAQTAPTPADREPPPDQQRVRTAFFAVDLPAHWRELTPNESVRLQDRLPADFPPIRPGWAQVFGDVDTWLDSGYDGRALVAGVASESEAPADRERIAAIRAHWASTTYPGGGRRDVLRGRVTELGPDDHPALELVVRGIETAGRRDQALEFHVSTSGRELILSFRTWEDAWAREVSGLRAMADSLTFARPPRDPEDLQDRLAEALLIGAAVGLLLLGLRYIARRGPHRPRSLPPPGSV